MKKIQIVPISERENMRKMLNNYLIELSEFDKTIKIINGVPEYRWFDCYWEDKDRFPIYFFVDDVVAGFALVRELENLKYEIAEFYVLNQFRGDGNSLWFAEQLLNLFAGQFEFSTDEINVRAVKFWNKFSQKYSCEGVAFCGRVNYVLRANNAKVHTLGLKGEYFELIKNGQKTVEGRLNDEKRKNYQVGDYIIFGKEPERIEQIKTIILEKIECSSFKQLIEKVSQEALGFAGKTPSEVEHIYNGIYSTANEMKFGTLGIRLKVVD